MDKENFIKYAPLILVVLAFLVQYNVFVQPKDLETTHREILNEIDNKYATKAQTTALQNQYDKLSEKLDRVLYILTDGKHYEQF